jgi:hypothetical protein
MLRAALARVGTEEMKTALALTADPRFQAPKAVTNAINALRKHRDPVGAVGKAPYRAVVPYVAAAVADACLSRTIEVLGEHSDDPTSAQLLDALDQIRGTFADVTIAVMLAWVADSDMPASDLCFDIVATDGRFGLTRWSEFESEAGTAEPVARASAEPTPAQREARRAKKRKDAEERRKKMEVARKAGEQVRRTRKQGRTGPAAASAPGSAGPGSAPVRTAPRLTRRASLTPLQEEEFDRQDPWVAGVVFAWVPFDTVDPARPDLDGKDRRCVVVAGSPTHLLVRPGYSEGGSKSRDWKSVPLRHWKQAGFERPTWIDTDWVRIPRAEVQAPVGWLTPEDWNTLW